jgi:hypothetical protein
VSDSNRQPIIGIEVDLRQVDHAGNAFSRRVTALDAFLYRTDDTGTYRIYGLPAGRYRVSVGEPPRAGAIRFEGGYYGQTFHPDATDESKAEIIELGEGQEVRNVDISVGPFLRSYRAGGRIVDSETGEPMAGMLYGYGAISDSGRYVGSVGLVSTRSTVKGEFYIDGLPAGRYAAFTINEGDSQFYCEPTLFDVANGDVDGIEISAKRGASISGIIAFDDGASLGDTRSLVIDVNVLPSALEAFRRDTVRIMPDGSFSAVGLRPGQATIGVRGWVGGKSVTLSHVERNGVAQQVIELGSGEAVTGLRLVLSHGPISR